ncbi:MAG: hypothetical protein ACMUHY_08525 [Thermoplasmatota archaeon]
MRIQWLSVLLLLNAALSALAAGTSAGSEDLGPSRPFETFYTDPELFTDMELDAEENVVYLGTTYGLIVKDLENDDHDFLGNWFGFENSFIMDLELDEEHDRLFIVTHESNTFYILDTEDLSITGRFSMNWSERGKKVGIFGSIAYDPANDVLYLPDHERLFRYSLSEGEFEVFDLGEIGILNETITDYPALQKMVLSEGTQDLIFATDQGLKVLDIETMNITHTSFDGSGGGDVYDVVLDDDRDLVYFSQDVIRRYDLKNGSTMDYPYIIEDYWNDTIRSSFSTVFEHEHESLWKPFRLGYDPSRDELYCQYGSGSRLLKFKGSAPELIKAYHFTDYEGLNFAELRTCKILHDPIGERMLFGMGEFRYRGSAGSNSIDGQARLAWYDPDGDVYSEIDLMRRNPGDPTRSDFYILETSPYLEGLAVGNEETLYILDEDMRVERDFRGVIENVYDLEFRGKDLFVAARNGTFAYSLMNNSLRRIELETEGRVCSIEVGSTSNDLYLGTAYGIIVYDPQTGSEDLIRAGRSNITNGRPGNLTYRINLVPSGLYIDPGETIGYMAVLDPYELLEADLVSRTYRFVNNITEPGNDEVVWKDLSVSQAVYSKWTGGPILITHHGFRNESFELPPYLPQTASLNGMYLDEERDVLYAVTGNFLGFDGMGHVPTWPAGSPFGFFVIDLVKGTWKNYDFDGGFPWDHVKGFTYDEYRDRFYFAGERCIFHIDRADIGKIEPREFMEETLVQEKMVEDGEGRLDDEDDRRIEAWEVVAYVLIMVPLVVVVGILVYLQRSGEGPTRISKEDERGFQKEKIRMKRPL